MATKRQRSGGNWEFIVRRKGLLPKPVSFTFKTEAEGDAYCSKLEALLDRGIVPQELIDERPSIATIADAIRAYLLANAVAESDKPVLNTLWGKKGTELLRKVDYAWAEGWVRSMKHDEQLAPATIRIYVGSLARCFDWMVRRQDSTFVTNPLRLLPKRYASYNDADAAVLRAASDMGQRVEVPADISRDRRLMEGEEGAIRRIMAGEKPVGKQRPLALKWQGAIEFLFELGLESAMRMREMYTLSVEQFDVSKRTVFLEKTKNGDKRQVPLTSVAQAAYDTYRQQVEAGERGMAGWQFDGGRLFPWWDGDPSPRTLKQTTALLSRQFVRIFEAAGCVDLGFHDLRHEFS